MDTNVETHETHEHCRYMKDTNVPETHGTHKRCIQSLDTHEKHISSPQVSTQLNKGERGLAVTERLNQVSVRAARATSRINTGNNYNFRQGV